MSRHPYVPRGRGETEAMLRSIGVDRFEDLLAPVPETFRLREPLKIRAPRSEFSILRDLGGLAEENGHGGNRLSFLGGGCSEHFVPAAVDHLSFRSEFYTAYTPYQPEVAQGTLSVIFEFQTMMAELTGMDVANASLYDGASALAEAVLLARATTKRPRVVVAGPLHPHARQVLTTFGRGQGVEFRFDPAPDGVADRAWVADALGGEPAAVVAAVPNVYGIVDDVSDLFAQARNAGAKAIAVFDPHALALYKSPGEMGADLAVGEGIGLGTSPSFGGPGLGLFSGRQDIVRLMPGRLVGQTVDRNGDRAFVLTLQTREQHIRRERATSNICTNQGLLALRASIYLSLLGPEGLREVAEHCLEKAHYAADALAGLNGFSLAFDRPFFQEFVLRCPRPAREIVAGARREGVIPGIPLDRLGLPGAEAERGLLVCVHEMHTRDDLDRLAEAVKEAGHA